MSGFCLNFSPLIRVCEHKLETTHRSNTTIALMGGAPPSSRETTRVNLENATESCKHLVHNVEHSFSQARLYKSKVTESVLEIEGMSGKKTRHFYNNLCAVEGTRYLEIGTWKGSSICAAMCNNSMTCVANDNFEEFGGPKEEFFQNFYAFQGSNNATFIEANCWDLDPENLGKFNVYLYDGIHDKAGHFQALNHFMPCLDNEFVFVVDDWNWGVVREGTIASIESNGLDIIYQKEVFTNGGSHPPSGPGVGDRAGKYGDWHNGIAIFVLQQHKAELSE